MAITQRKGFKFPRYRHSESPDPLGPTVVETNIVSGAETVFRGTSCVASENVYEAIEIDQPVSHSMGNEPEIKLKRIPIPIGQLDQWLAGVESEASSGAELKYVKCRYLVVVNGFFNYAELAHRVYKALRLSQYHLQCQLNELNVDVCTQSCPSGLSDCYARLIWNKEERLSFATHYESSARLTTGLLLVTSEHTRVSDWLEVFQQRAFDHMLLPTLILETICHKVKSVNLDARFYHLMLTDLTYLQNGFGQDDVFESDAQQLTARQLGDIHNRIMAHLGQMRDDRREVLATLAVELARVLKSKAYCQLCMPRDVA